MGATTANARTLRDKFRCLQETDKTRRPGGGAEGARTPDLRIANNRVNHSGIIPSVTFAPIFRDLTAFCPRLAVPNVPETSVHDYTRITPAGSAALYGRSSIPMPASSKTLPALVEQLAERLLDFERLDEAWPHAVAEHATFDLKSASRAVRT